MPKGIKKDGTKLGFQKGNKIRVGIKPANAFIKGSRLSEKIKEKMRKARQGGKPALGKFHTDVWKRNHSQFMIGQNNPMWKGGISFEPYSLDWTKTLKRSIRERDNYTCQLCGRTQIEELEMIEKKLPVHHIDYNKKDCNPINLITLCNSCNSKVNSNREFWTEYFSTLKEEIS